MTAVQNLDTASRPASAGVLLAVPAVVVFVPVLILLLLLVPAWLAVLVAVAAAAAVTWWAWARATAVVRRQVGGVAADPDRHARLVNVVEGLCLAAGVQAPAVQVVDDPAANALVAGRDERDAVLFVTTGLLDATDRVELEGVIAHQLVQLRDHGLDAATLTVTTVGLPILLADRLGLGGALLRAAAGLSGLRRLGVGEDRQTTADLDAVALTRYPPGLLGALEACERTGTVVAPGTRATAHLWLATPIPTDGDPAAELNRRFVGPRDLAERIDILREL